LVRFDRGLPLPKGGQLALREVEARLGVASRLAACIEGLRAPNRMRLRLVKLATRVVALKTRGMLHLPSACPDQAILRLALERLPRLAC
jgi:hypothetical protein